MKKNIKSKKWLLYTYFILAAILTGTSCITDNDDLPDCSPQKEKKDALVVTAGLYCNNKLIAWEEGSKIGVYLIDNEKECLLQDSLGAPYLLNDADKGLFLHQWGMGNEVPERPTVGISYDATGIYPYETALKSTQSVTLSVADQSDPGKLDLFTPIRVHGITADTDTIHLDFYRRMSRLLFNLTLTEVKPDQSEVEADAKLAGATIQVNGLPTEGTFTFEKNELETGDPQPFQAYMAENGKQGQAIVFPYSSTQDVRFLVSLPQYPDTLYSFVLSEDMILEACSSYTLNLPLKYIYKPEIKHYNVKYRYEGIANKDNVTVTRGDNLIGWGEGDIIVVDENSEFTFQYQSSLKVSVRTEDGEVLPMSPGKPHTFNQIQKDITIIIHAEEEDPGPGPGPGPNPEITHKVTYRYEGEANASNVTVFKNGMSINWTQNETITVKDKEDFTFGLRSDMIVSVRTKDGGTLSIGSGNPYTFKEVDKDIEIIIYAETPEYAVKYIFEGEHTEGNVSVEKAISQGNFSSWGKTETVYVREGNDFTFKANSGFTISVKVKGEELPKNADSSYTLKDIFEDITVVISTHIHKVTYKYVGEADKDNVSVYKDKNLSQQWMEKTEVVLVDHGADFTFGTDSRHEVAVAGNGATLSETPVSGSATKNTFRLQNVTKDVVVTIGAVTEEDLLEHKVQYVFIGDATANNTDVTISDNGWSTEDIKVVADGSDFTFNAKGRYTLTVTATLTNDNGVNVPVEVSGDSYAIKNVKKNVTVYISATTYKVNYIYSGSYVDASRVPISIEGGDNPWKEEQEGTQVVDSNSDFTFINNSKYTVTVSGYGEQFTIAPGASHKLENITENINLVITADICKVTYQFDNGPSEEVEKWLDVKYDNKDWTVSNAGVQYIEKGKDFEFYTAPKNDVSGVAIEYVKADKTDETGMTGNNGKYTLTITKDTEFHIKAVKTHQITYEIKTVTGTTQPSDFYLFKDSNTSWEEGDGGKVIIHAGKDFTFRYTSDKLNEYTITVTENNNPITMGKDNTYTKTNVQEKIHYIITLAKKPQLIIEADDGITPSVTGGYVDYDSGKLFIPTVDPKWEITVTVTGNGSDTGTTLTPDQNGQYTVGNITKDTTITLRKHRKPADMPINADIHIWEELPAINGGIIYPKSK